MSQKCEQNEKTSENGSAGIALLSIMFDVAMRNDKSKTFSVVKDLLKSSSSPKKSNDDDAVDDSTGDKSGDDCDDNDDSKGSSDRDAFKEKMVELLDTIREQNIDSDKKSSLLTSRLEIDDLNALSEYLSDLIERGARDADGDDRLLSEDRKMVVVLLKLFSSFSPSSVFDEKKMSEMSDLLVETTNARKASSDDSSKTTTGGSKRGSATVPKKTGLFILRDGCRIRPSRLYKGDTMSKVKYEMDETTHRDNFDAHATVWRIKEYETVPDEEDRVPKLKTYNLCIEFLKAWIIVDQKQARPKLGIKFLTKTDCQRANLTFDKVAKDFIFDTFKKLDFIEWVPRRRNDDDDDDDDEGDSSMEVEKNDQNVSDDRRSGIDSDRTNDGDRSLKKSAEKDDDKEDDVEKKERIAKISDNIERLYRIFKRQTVYDVEKGFYLESEDSEKIFELEEDDERSPSQIFFDTFSKLLPFVIKKDEKESAKRERLAKKGEGEGEDENEDEDHSVYFGVMHQETENQKNAEKIPRWFYKSEDLYVPTSPAIADKRFSSEGFNNFFQPNCLYFKNKERFDEYVAKLTRCSLDVDAFNTFVLTSLASSSRAKKKTNKTTIAPPSKKKSQKYDMPKMKKRGGRTSSSSSSDGEEEEKKVVGKVRSKQKKATSSSSPNVAVKKSTKKKTVDADDSKKESDRKKTAKVSSKSKKQESTKVDKKNTNTVSKKRAREDDEDASDDERVSKKRRSDSNANKKPQKKKTDKHKPSSSSSSSSSEEEEENKKKPTARASKKNGDDWDF